MQLAAQVRFSPCPLESDPSRVRSFCAARRKEFQQGPTPTAPFSGRPAGHLEHEFGCGQSSPELAPLFAFFAFLGSFVFH